MIGIVLFASFAILLLSINQTSPYVSFRNQLAKGLLFQNLRLGSWRGNLIQMCFAQFSFAAVFLASLMFAQISFSLPIIVACVLWLTPLKKAAKIFFLLGIFLLAAEKIGPNIMFLRNLAGELPFIYWLADGRLLTCFAWMAAAIVLSGALKIENWSIPLGFILIPSGLMAANVGISLFIGEIFGSLILVLYTFSKTQESVRKMSKILLSIYFPLGLLSWWLAGAVQIDPFWIKYMILAILPSIALGIAGHFIAKKPIEDYQESKIITPKQLKCLSLHEDILNLAKSGATKRMAEIKNFRQDFEKSNWEKVPLFVKETSKKELESLAALF